MSNIVFVRPTSIYNDSRATKEIAMLLEAGHFVTVLGWDRNGDAVFECEKIFQSYADRVSFKFYMFLCSNGIGVKNFMKLFEFNIWVYRNLQIIDNFDKAHLCDFHCGISGMIFCKKRNIGYVYDIYDYFVDSSHVPKFLRPIVEKAEIAVINQSEATIICTEERREQISKAHPKKLLVVYNSPDVSSAPKNDEEYDYTYCGGMYDSRLLKEIFERYPFFSELKFITAGQGKYDKLAQDMSGRFENFSFLGSVPYSKVLEVEGKSKVMSAIYDPTFRNSRLCAPNKFYEALALAKPVIVCRGTGIDKIVRENNIGIVIDYSVDEFFQAVKYLCENDAIRIEMGQRARRLYEREYKWSLMKERLLPLYQ